LASRYAWLDAVKILTPLAFIPISALITSCGNDFARFYVPEKDVSTAGVVPHKNPVPLKNVSSFKEARKVKDQLKSLGYRHLGTSSWFAPKGTMGYSEKKCCQSCPHDWCKCHR
jgi:hypothetical protein